MPVTGGPVLVTGGTGQVGSAVMRRLAAAGVEAVAPGRAGLDLSDPESIRGCVREIAPRWVVSCGAYTAVDAAEGDREGAFAANGVAPGVLAEAAAGVGAGLIHFSTDYVFDGSGERPWRETDVPAPLNVYGASKLAGEQAIAAVAGLEYVVLRTSWVYSGGGKNFVRTMVRLLSTRTEPLRIVADQHGAPTSAADLADAVLGIMRVSEGSGLAGRAGVYHCSGTGDTTWAGLAEAVREYLRLTHGLEPPEIVHVASSEYSTPATRPLNSRLNCGKLAAGLGLRMPHWRSSVMDALRELAATDLPSR